MTRDSVFSLFLCSHLSCFPSGCLAHHQASSLLVLSSCPSGPVFQTKLSSSLLCLLVFSTLLQPATMGVYYETWKMKVTQWCLILWDPMDCSLPGPSIHGILQARILKWVTFPFSRESSQPRDWTQVSCIASDSLPSEPPGKPKNTGAGSLSLLQEIFPTQESNWGLRQCRWILYQLSHQGRPLCVRLPCYFVHDIVS